MINLKHKQSQIQIFWTLSSTFLMGYLDAYTYLRHKVFVSAQTGNMITFSYMLFSKQWWNLDLNVSSLIGFSIGVLFGISNYERIQKQKKHPALFFFITQLIVLFFLITAQSILPNHLFIIFLSFVSGFNLYLFNRLQHTPVNVGIMTGNIRNILTYSYEAVKHKNKQSQKHVLHLSWILICFAFGVGIGTLIVEWQTFSFLWIPIVLTLISLLLSFKDSKFYQKLN